MVSWMIAGFGRWGVSLGVALVVSSMLGCKTEPPPAPAPVQAGPVDYGAELPAGTLALQKIPLSEYPDFSQAMLSRNVKDLGRAIDNSLLFLAKPSTQAYFPYLDITHDRAVATLCYLRSLVAEESKNASTDNGAHFNQVIRQSFEVYKSVGAPKADNRGYTGDVLFTGYVTPIYNASLTKSGPYQYPIYKRPMDLVMDATGTTAQRRQTDGTLVPYYTRQQIDTQHVLDGQELLWLADRFDAYVIAIQGSAKLRLTNGKMMEIGYAGNNGYEYTSPRQQLISDGVITKQNYGLRAMREYFHAHPEQIDKYLSVNQRYIFFSEQPGGPFGSLGVPVTSFATIATDKTVYPRSMPAFLSTTVPTEAGTFVPFKSLVLDQDTGGGIRASGRCDIYMGVGDQAEKIAGQQQQTGQLYYLAIKPELLSRYLPSGAK